MKYVSHLQIASFDKNYFWWFFVCTAREVDQGKMQGISTTAIGDETGIDWSLRHSSRFLFF